MSATREDVVAAARAWLGTPYVHQADVLGQGVDCAMLLVRVYCDLGLAPAFDPRPYAPEWYLHQDEERYLGWVGKYARRVGEPELAGVALYRVGRCVAHGAIIVGAEGLAVHAYSETRRVELATLAEIGRMRGAYFHSYWSVFA